VPVIFTLSYFFSSYYQIFCEHLKLSGHLQVFLILNTLNIMYSSKQPPIYSYVSNGKTICLDSDDCTVGLLLKCLMFSIFGIINICFHLVMADFGRNMSRFILLIKVASLTL
jgi:hypothetical protein